MELPPRVAVAVVGSWIEVQERVLTELPAGAVITFFPDPADIVIHAPDWRRLLSEGHCIGNGTLFRSALEDGSLPLWTPIMVEHALQEADALLKEVFGLEVPQALLPRGPRRCADDQDYLPLLAPRIYLCEYQDSPTPEGSISYVDGSLQNLQWVVEHVGDRVLLLDASEYAPGLLKRLASRYHMVPITAKMPQASAGVHPDSPH